jgi:hypothetical protein
MSLLLSFGLEIKMETAGISETTVVNVLQNVIIQNVAVYILGAMLLPAPLETYQFISHTFHSTSHMLHFTYQPDVLYGFLYPLSFHAY